MTTRIFWTAFAVGLAAVLWVTAGFAGTQWVAFAMSCAVGATYLLGAWELRQHRLQTHALAQALAALKETPPALAPWLEHVPAGLRTAVRQRVESERGALPGPALTPYLVGLLVMLGMLGTFLGMVVTFRGAVFALEGSTDLAAIRAALAEPIRGLGLSFGTSVAGVAASAMLGLMSAAARRERMDVARLLDACVAGVLRPFSMVQQREQAFAAVQAQAATMPRIVEQLQALMERIEQRNAALDDKLLASQQRFHSDTAASYESLAQAVGRSLEQSLAAGAKSAGESIRPVMESAMAGIVADTARLHERLAQAAHEQVQALSARFDATSQQAAQRWDASLQSQARADAERLQAWSAGLQEIAAGVRSELQHIAADAGAQARRASEDAARVLVQAEELLRSRMDSESQWLAQHGERMDSVGQALQSQLQALRDEEARRGQAAVERLGDLQAALAQHLGTQSAALEAPLARLLQTASEVPQAAAGVLAQLRAEMARLSERENVSLQERTVLVERLGTLVDAVETASQRAGEMSTQAAANAIELSTWGEAFAQGVQQFQAGNDKMVTTLQQVEAAIQRSTARSDEQLAYYVAQAREVIDLSIASQHGIVDKLRQLAGKPAAIVTEPRA